MIRLIVIVSSIITIITIIIEKNKDISNNTIN